MPRSIAFSAWSQTAAWGSSSRPTTSFLARVSRSSSRFLELAHLPSVSERFLAEARLCARIENEHVVRILDVSKVHGLPYIVMEFVSGTSLAALLGTALVANSRRRRTPFKYWMGSRRCIR